jgi:hypothetical protein
MRVLLAVILLASGLVSVVAALATDEPEAVARSNRSAKSQFNHYYPTTGAKPKTGRSEDLEAPRIAIPEQDNTYRRKY